MSSATDNLPAITSRIRSHGVHKGGGEYSHEKCPKPQRAHEAAGIYYIMGDGPVLVDETDWQLRLRRESDPGAEEQRDREQPAGEKAHRDEYGRILPPPADDRDPTEERERDRDPDGLPYPLR